MKYETLRKYAREGRVADAKTALKIADDAGIDRPNGGSGKTKKAATL